jgi:hypothetical protein
MRWLMAVYRLVVEWFLEPVLTRLENITRPRFIRRK